MKIQTKKMQVSIVNCRKEVASCENKAAEEASFSWSHHRISCADIKFITTFQDLIVYSGSERVSLNKKISR